MKRYHSTNHRLRVLSQLILRVLASLVILVSGCSKNTINSKYTILPETENLASITVSGDAEGLNGTTHSFAVDDNIQTYFKSSHNDWQYIQIEFDEDVQIHAFRRYMSIDADNYEKRARGCKGEGFSYSSNGSDWYEIKTYDAIGWEDYFEYSAHIWHNVKYGWSSLLSLKKPKTARYIRLNWEGNNDRVNEIEIQFLEKNLWNITTDFHDVPNSEFRDAQDLLVKMAFISEKEGQHDGFVAVGHNHNRIKIAKYLPDGQLDKSFGGFYVEKIGESDDLCSQSVFAIFNEYSSGQVSFLTLPSATGLGVTVEDQASDVIVTQEHIIFAGHLRTALGPPNNSISTDFLLGRINLSSGSRDCAHIVNGGPLRGFGQRGFVTLDFGPGRNSEANAIAIEQPEDGGRLIVVGNVFGNKTSAGLTAPDYSKRKVGIARIINNRPMGLDGVLDNTFGVNANPGNGLVILDFSSPGSRVPADVTCDDVLIENGTDNGVGANIIITGSYKLFAEDESAINYIARISGTGEVLDIFFGSVAAGNRMYPRAMKWAPNGQIVVGGERIVRFGNHTGFLQSYNPNTGLDSTFGADGFIDPYVRVNDLAINRNGTIFIVGPDHNNNLKLVRYGPNGRRIDSLEFPHLNIGHTRNDFLFGSLLIDDYRAIVGGINWRETPTTRSGVPNFDFAIRALPRY